ncbi:NAD(P)-binding protein [Derxia lacustris]|uniref:NAD(P)-binding protein n=1 Tax=Derxia lacustris TaxID=764842 RepID=UPI0015948E9A|nr:NAD(P)-binding protein [Derxia lacustris]
MSQEQQALRIAIVGGGISGLAAAYQLKQRRAGSGGRPLDIQLFERLPGLGGNADTVVVELGRHYGRDADAGPSEPFHRWADLGVNDANLSAYKRMVAMMQTVGFNLHVEMKPLLDTASYTAADGSVTLTDDAGLSQGVSQSRMRLGSEPNAGLLTGFSALYRLGLDKVPANDGPPGPGEVGDDYTVDDFLRDTLRDLAPLRATAAMLIEEQRQASLGAADPYLPPLAPLPADDARVRQLVQQAADDILYPRIGAMYFADPEGPGTMPLRSPFQYYKVQEGGKEQPYRCYFDFGAHRWLETLDRWLVNSSDAAVRYASFTGCPVQVELADGKAVVHRLDADGRRQPGEPGERFDLVISAVHADNALDLIAFGANPPRVGEASVPELLASLRYTASYAVCHTDSHRLPRDRAAWRTYNIPVRKNYGDGYRIDYVVNYHQNDPANPVYDAAGLPEYFVSLLNRADVIPEALVLDRVAPAAHQRHAQAGVAAGASGYRDCARGQAASGGAGYAPDKAWTLFKHNVLDANCLKVQRQMAQFNASVGAHRLLDGAALAQPILFTGGWMLGAGLHEQCIEQAERLAELIYGAGPGARVG